MYTGTVNDMHENVTTRVKTLNELTESFPIKIGLNQGSTHWMNSLDISKIMVYVACR